MKARLPDLAFPKTMRLRQGSEFRRVFQQPLKSSDACLTVLARNNTLGFPRLGLSIAKKKVKLAVHRNRVKRLIREAFRQQQWSIGHLDFVVMAKVGLSEKSNAEITHSIRQHWQVILRKCEKSSLQ